MTHSNSVRSIRNRLFLLLLRAAVGALGAFMEVGLSLCVAPVVYCGVWLVIPNGRQTLIAHSLQARQALRTLLAMANPAGSSDASDTLRTRPSGR